MRQKSILLLLLEVLCAWPVTAQLQLVKDINPLPQEGSSSPDRYVRFGKYVLFAASTVTTGRELWASDGTAGGTYLLVDACPAECSGSPFPIGVTPRGVFFVTWSENFSKGFLWVTQGTPATTFLLTEGIGAGGGVWMESQGVLYFRGSDQAHGSELWRTDGTAAGTYLVADIWPGPSDGNLGELVVFKGRLFFSATDGVTGTALWTSDGTAAGTRIVKDTSPGNSVYEGPLRQLVASSKYLFFRGPGPAGWELWRSDGTAKGTKLVADLVPGPSGPSISAVTVVGSRIYMEADVDFTGQELWVSDGTKAGTRKLTNFIFDRPFAPHPLGPQVRSLAQATAIGDRLFFIAGEVSLGRQVWVTDGTSKGTHVVTNFCPATCVGVLSLWPALQNRVFFAGSDGQLGLELWSTDGTAAGTRIVQDLCAPACSSWPNDPTVVGGQLFFTADGGTGRQLWRTDATATGAVQLSDLQSPNLQNGLQRVAGADKLFFTARDPDHGEELWISDGSLPGTHLVMDLDPADHGGSSPDTFMTTAGTLFFFADDGQHGGELWKSDGTTEGTTLVHEFSPGPQALTRFSHFEPNVESGGLLYFILEAGANPRALWRTDGTDTGTVRLTPEDGEPSQNAFEGGPVAAGGKVFFNATDRLHGKELWVTDGTPAGTSMVADLEPGPYGAEPTGLTAFQGKVFFSAKLSPLSTYRVLWKSDGTETGTVPVTEAAQNPLTLTPHQGFLYFSAEDNEHGREIWRTDGTEAGTRIAVDVIPGGRSLEMSFMTSLGSRLLFGNGRDGQGNSPPSLWVSDGTEAGTHRIGSVRVGFSLTQWPILDGVLYFGSQDASTEGLWRTDGTEVGTFPLRDMNGRIIPPPHSLAAFDGRLYFITPDLGATLWRSDGTPQGTVPLRELEPGKSSSRALAATGSHLFFPAFDPATGTELWAIGKR